MHEGLIFNHLCGRMDNSWPRSTALKGQFTQLKIMSDTDEHFSKLAAEFYFPSLSAGERRRGFQHRSSPLVCVFNNRVRAEMCLCFASGDEIRPLRAEK